jgi:foldase protein PrsA
VGISLELYNRQIAQAQSAMVQNFGTDPKSAQGQEALKSLKQQVLDQLINDVVIAQYAETRKIKVTDNELNARIAQMIQDAGSVDKLNEYMTKNQLTLADLCLLVRNQLLGELVLNDITAPIPTQGEQVHVRHILVDTPALAAQVRDLARKPGADFAALAKQYSKDETSKANGGDLGWVPRGVLDPALEAVIFQLPINQVSDVVTTQFGYHVALVMEKDKARPLPPEVIQNVRQDAFLKWLRAMRDNTKIERFVQP